MTDAPHPVNGGRPDPDPTVLTTQALYREIGQLRELLVQRIESLIAERDRATEASVRRQDTLVVELAEHRIALRELVEERIIGLNKLMDHKFESAERQRTEQKSDTKAAVDAALSAAKEAVKEQTTASGLSISKSEAATASQLKQQQETFTTAIDGLRRSIDELKDRETEDIRNLRQTISDVATTANGTVQRSTGAVDNRTAIFAVIAVLGSIVVASVAVIGLVLK